MSINSVIPSFKIEENLGISVDGLTTPTLPQYVPPLMLMTPWVVKVMAE